ncbi:protoporphyrinogen oxidase [candidate division GN15 bacterium]|nr:protoporphyrinogen oxidase [candidate division GN15 bacterium]
MPDRDVVIIGGGISGLTALHFLRTRQPDGTVTLLEAAARLGGTIGTDHVQGHSFDWGPNGFLDREPLTLQVCDELGLDDTLERANPNVSNRFICRDSTLRAVPSSPGKFLTSDILSLKGRLRVLWEPFAPSANAKDESIYDFASRRIGREAADYLVQPMVSGVYGGVATKLSLKSCFSIMHKMESEHGSLVKAMIARKRAAKAEGKKSGGPSGPGGWLTSFSGGLYALIERFHELYRDHIRLEAPVESLTRDDESWVVHCSTGETLSARSVIIATPSYKAADMVQSVSKRLSDHLAAIPYAPIAVVCTGFDREAVVHPLDGFGFLVPAKEKRDILGSIWTSSIFADRAPGGQVQFRTMLGGDGNHAVTDWSDTELVTRACGDLKDIVGLKAEPTVARVYRWDRGIPQFVIGHGERMASVEKELIELPGLHLAGNAYYGIGLNDCVKQALYVTDRIRNDQ